MPGLATFLCQRRELIVASWIDAVRQNPRIGAANHTDDRGLADHLPQLFDDLADLLRGEPAAGAEVARDAEKHGGHRWRQHYALGEVLDELSMVCDLVLELGLDAFEDAHPGVSKTSVRRARKRVLHFFDDTVAGSARQHVRHQQEQRDLAHGERREADLALAAAVQSDHDRLADVFKRSPSFIALLRGPEHIFELANDRYRQLVGDRDLLHRPVREALPDVAGQGFFELLDRVYTTGEPFVGNDVKILLQAEAGSSPREHFLDFVYLPVRTAEGIVSGVFVHGVDWTERKAAESELAHVAEQRRIALDAAQLGWWHHDLTTGLVEWDERTRTLYGRPLDRLPIDEALVFIHPDDRAGRGDTLRAALRPDDPQPYAVEYRVVRPDGGICWLQVKGQASFAGVGAERRPVSIDGTVADITEARAAQEALRESEARFRELADAMPQIVFAGRPDGTLDYYNRQWYDYTGGAPGAIGDEGWKEWLHPDDYHRTLETWTACVRAGQAYEAEFRVRRAADGAYRWFLGRAVPIKDAAGRVLRWLGTDTDIHERKQLHEQIEQLLTSERAARSEAERTSHMKDEFLATLSHELRTPLNAILGWTQVLRGDPGNAEDIEAGLATIERNAKAQTQIIEDLLDMSRIISGKVRLDVQRLDLVGVVEAALETVRPAASAKGIRLLPVLDPQARSITGDPNRLQQVFWNLLSNAIKFTPKGGRVQVVLARVDSHLEVSVIDSGEGIAPEFLPHVFDRFRQQDASTTRRHGGLGLGLAIVKQLAELHGGSVQVESGGLGQGTTFRVSLPLTVLRPPSDQQTEDRRHSQAEAPSFSIPAELLQLDGVNVLVVDDEEDARALIQRLLEDRGAKVTAVGSVAEAVSALSTKRPDVLVSDIGMPKEDGYALIRRVRALSPEEGGNTPAIALTAYARAEDRLKAIMAGFQIHVTKPVDATELLAVVATLAGRMRARENL